MNMHDTHIRATCNDRFYAQVELAHACVQRLSRMGCQVEHVALGGVRPVIYIIADRAAARIPAAIYKREQIHGQVHCTWVASVMGCQVRWKGEYPSPHSTSRRPLPVHRQGVEA